MEPLHISNEEKSDDDNNESSRDDKSTKRKRVLAAKGLHFVPPVSRREAAEKQSKAAKKPEEIFEDFKDKANEVPETPEAEPDSLDPTEAQLVASALAEARREEIDTDQDDDVVEAEVDHFLELVQEGATIEAAAEAWQHGIGVSDEEIAQTEAELPSRPELFENEEEAPAEAHEIPLSESGEGGFNLPPPPPPRGPDGPNFSSVPNDEGPRRSETVQTVPARPIENTPNTPKQKRSKENYYHYHGVPIFNNELVGGIAGYYIGKKRGRKQERKIWKKAENKIKKQVEDINWQLKAQEVKIRKLTREKKDAQVLPRQETTANREPNKVSKQSIFESQAAKTFEAKIMPPVEILKASPVEASRLHPPLFEASVEAAVAAPLITARESIRETTSQRVVYKTVEASPEKNVPEKSKMLPRNITERQVQTLNRNELLRLSEHISIEGSTLRQIYDTHLIGERGLRRLVAEHLRGGDVKAMLKEEIVEHEIDFERDPAIRNSIPISSSSPEPSNDPKSTLDKMVEAAASSLGGSSSDTAPSYINKTKGEQANEAFAQEKIARPFLDGFLALLIVIALAAVLLLLYRR